MLGFLVPRMIEKFEASITEIFAILSMGVDKLEWLPGTQEPSAFVWNMLQDFYGRDWAAHVSKLEKQAEELDSGLDMLAKMAEGMKIWL